MFTNFNFSGEPKALKPHQCIAAFKLEFKNQNVLLAGQIFLTPSWLFLFFVSNPTKKQKWTRRGKWIVGCPKKLFYIGWIQLSIVFPFHPQPPPPSPFFVSVNGSLRDLRSDRASLPVYFIKRYIAWQEQQHKEKRRKREKLFTPIVSPVEPGVFVVSIKESITVNTRELRNI